MRSKLLSGKHKLKLEDLVPLKRVLLTKGKIIL
jgi:hypothetical protein